MVDAFPQDLDACRVVAQQANQASWMLAQTGSDLRNAGLLVISEALQNAKNDILEANTLDLEASREMAIPEIIQEWLKLTPERLQSAIHSLRHLAHYPDPLNIGEMSYPGFGGNPGYCRRVPLGVIALVYEAFPELGIIATGLCLKSGNSLILRGTSEASHSNAVIAEVIQSAIAKSDLPEASCNVLPAADGHSLRELITQSPWINLVIPYGRPSLVQQVLKTATVPTLKTVIGNCYLYWSATGNGDTVRSIILDSHQGQPDAVNAIEKVLVHSQHNVTALARLLASLREQKFSVRIDETLAQDLPDLPIEDPDAWSEPYLSRVVSFKRVENLNTAVHWMNAHSSGHANCIVTESYSESQRFTAGVHSSLVYINSSPRFYRSLKPGDPLYIGICTDSSQQGMIGIERLTKWQYLIQGRL